MFYSRLERVCCAQGLSVSKACVKAGLHRSSYLAWKHGRMPSARSLSRMAKALGITTDDLRCEAGDSSAS